MSVSTSTTVTRLRDAVRELRAAFENSTVRKWVRSTGETVGTARQESRVARAARWLQRITTASWLYRWFTAEPDPTVVVIDLRDTWTVGPMLAVLDRLAASLTRSWSEASSRPLLERLSESVYTQPVRAASIVVLAAVVTNLVALFAFGTPTAAAVGPRLVVASLALGGTRVSASAGELAESRPVGVFVSLLEPPDPPEDRRTDPDSDDGTDSNL